MDKVEKKNDELAAGQLEIESLLRQILAALQEHNRLIESFIDAAQDRRTSSWSSCSQATEDLKLLRDTIRLLAKCAGRDSEPPYRVTTIAASPSPNHTYGVSSVATK